MTPSVLACDAAPHSLFFPMIPCNTFVLLLRIFIALRVKITIVNHSLLKYATVVKHVRQNKKFKHLTRLRTNLEFAKYFIKCRG